LGLVKLIVAPKKETIALAHQLAERVGQGDRERMIEFIETVLLYKFPQMSREEIEAMFTLGDLKKTRVYRDALKEGKLEGKLEGVKIGTQRGQVLGLKQFAVKLLTRKFGKVTLKTVKRLDKLSAERLEELAEAVLDFEKVADLDAWLASKK
jgi:predicted transposase YdaD